MAGDIKCDNCGTTFTRECSRKRHIDERRCPALSKVMKKEPIVLTPKPDYEKDLRIIPCCDYLK